MINLIQSNEIAVFLLSIENLQKPCSTKSDAEHLDKRSVDGSESKFTQWELELQASMEKLNRLSIENSLRTKGRVTQNSSNLRDTIEVDTVNRTCYDPLSTESSNTSDSNQFSRSTENSETLERDRSNGRSHLLKSCSTTGSTTALRGASTLALKSNISKSLNSSPVNRGMSDFETRITDKAESADVSRYVPNRISQFNIKNRKAQSNWDINAPNNADVNVSRKESGRNRRSNTNDTLANKNHVQFTNLCIAQVSNTEFLPAGSNLSGRHVAVAPGISQHLKNSQDDAALQLRSSSNILQKSAPCSANSSPVKLKNLSSARSLDTGSVDHLDKGSTSKKFANKTASIKELPLLSLFGQTSVLSALRGKSNSMINLSSKQNLKTLLDNSHQYTSNIQAISAERLANVRHKLVNDCSETKTGDVKK